MTQPRDDIGRWSASSPPRDLALMADEVGPQRSRSLAVVFEHTCSVLGTAHEAGELWQCAAGLATELIRQRLARRASPEDFKSSPGPDRDPQPPGSADVVGDDLSTGDPRPGKRSRKWWRKHGDGR